MIKSQTTIREKNLNRVLKEIINHPNISRAEIAKSTQLNKATVSELVRELIEKKYVSETGIGESSTFGGRRPILLKINKYAGITFSIDVRFNGIGYFASFLDGEVFEKKTYNQPIDNSNIVQIICDIVKKFREKMPKTEYGIVGITIAVHGIISDNKIVYAPYYNLHKLNLAEILENELKTPIFLENEANLQALAESTLDTKHKNIITCSIHTGVGAGIILNRSLYKGHQGRSGEIGHTTLYPNGKKCTCGNLGCLEQYCSETALLNEFRSYYKDNSLNLQDLINKYYEKDPYVLELIEKFATHLSIGIINLTGIFAPEIIYLSGDVISKIPQIANIISEKLQPTIYEWLPIKISKFAENSILYGATILGIQNFFNMENISPFQNIDI